MASSRRPPGGSRRATLCRKPPGNRGTGELPERVLSHPTRPGLRRSRKASRHPHCSSVERGIAFPDRTQGHVHGLLDEVAFVGGGALDEEKALRKRLVVGDLVMHGEAPQQCKRCSLDELVAPARPLRDLSPRVRRAVEQGKAHRIADSPVVEVIGTPNAFVEGMAYRAIPSRAAFVPWRFSQSSAARTSAATGRLRSMSGLLSGPRIDACFSRWL